MKTTSAPRDWYRNWFDERYLFVYRHRDDGEAVQFVEKWPIWSRVKAGALALDLGCGTGRYARALASRGVRTVAVDLSEALLRNALRLNGNPLQPWFVRADMRQIPLRGAIDLIISLFTSFGYFHDDEDHQMLLEEIHRLLNPGGIFILDLPNREFVEAYVADMPSSVSRMEEITVREQRWMDGNRVIKKIEIADPVRSREYFESVRLYSPSEMKVMLGSAGFTYFTPPWGDYSGTSYSAKSERMIFFLQKAQRE